MYLGVVACPQDEDKFYGRIILERVSRAKVLTSASKNKYFTEDVHINEAIKKGEWRYLIVDNMTVEELKVQMQNNHSLDGFVAERLHLSYETHRSGENKKFFCLNNMVTSVSILNSKMLMEMTKLVEYT